MLSEIDVPVICIQSTQNNFVKPLHTDPYVTRRGGEVRSIHKVIPCTLTMICLVLLLETYPQQQIVQKKALWRSSVQRVRGRRVPRCRGTPLPVEKSTVSRMLR